MAASRCSSAAARVAALLLAVAAMQAGATPAQAATVSLSTGSVHVDESAGTEDNSVVIDYSAGAWTVSEAGTTGLTAGSGCTGGATTVTCATAGPIQAYVSDAGGTNSYTMDAPYPSLMQGGSGPDTLTGGPSSDSLFGGDGADVLDGGDGTNQLQGGEGADVFKGGTAIGSFTSVQYDDGELRPAGVTVTIGSGANDGSSVDGTGDDVQDSVDLVEGTPQGDTMTGGGAGPDYLKGDAGDDELTGGSTAGDYLIGGAGNDTLTGGAGFDTVSYDYLAPGTPGVVATICTGGAVGTTDVDTYGPSIEQLYGSARDDTLTGCSGNDYLKGAGGDDHLDGAAGNDHLYGDSDQVFFAPASDDDTLTGGTGNDRLVGNEGDDTLNLDDGQADTLGGGSDCDGDPLLNQLPSGVSGGTNDSAFADASDSAPVNCENVDTGGGGGGGGGGGSGASAPPPPPKPVIAGGTPRPVIRGRAEAGGTMECIPPKVPDATSYDIVWNISTKGDQAKRDVATGSPFVIPYELAGYDLSCFVDARNESGASDAIESDVVSIAGIRGVAVAPAKRLAMPDFVYPAEQECGKAAYCQVDDVRRSLTFKHEINADVSIDYVGLDRVPAKRRPDVLPYEVVRQLPSPGEEIFSSMFQAQQVRLEVYRPPRQKRCALSKSTDSDTVDVADMVDGIKGQSLADARAYLKTMHCLSSQVLVDYHPRTGAYEPRVKQAAIVEEDGRKRLSLDVDYPPTGLQQKFVAINERADLPLGADGKLTVDRRSRTVFGVRAASPAGIGFHLARVELRDPDGKLLDRAFTGYDGIAPIATRIVQPGTYELVSVVEDADGNAIVGGQTITAIDRGGSRWTGFDLADRRDGGGGQALARGAAAATDPGTAVKVEIERTVEALYERLKRPDLEVLSLTAERRALLDDLIDSEDQLWGGFITLETAFRQGIQPQLVTYDSTQPLAVRAATVGAAAVYAAQAGHLVQELAPVVRPANGVVAVRFQPPGGRFGVTVFPTGTFVFDSAGGSLIGAAGPSDVVVDVNDPDLRLTPVSIVASGAGNLITNDGATLISNDGAGLIGNDGAGLLNPAAGIVASGAGNIVASGAGNIVASGAGNLIGNDGAGLIGNDGAGLIGNDGGS